MPLMRHALRHMIYKGCRYEIEQERERHLWRWKVFLDAHQVRTGVALTRGDAISAVEAEVDEAEQDGELL